MALPNSVNKLIPDGATESARLLDDRIRNLTLAVEDFFGIPDNTSITSAFMTAVAAGLDEVIFSNAALNASAAGRLRRNGAKLTWHDGTAARSLGDLRLLATSDVEVTATIGPGGFTLKTLTTDLNGAALNIPSTSYVKLMGLVRKNAQGVADTISFAIGVNGTNITTFRSIFPSSTLAGAGIIEVTIGPMISNYGRSLLWHVGTFDGNVSQELTLGPIGASVPAGTITSLSIQGQNSGNGMLYALSQVKLWEMIGA